MKELSVFLVYVTVPTLAFDQTPTLQLTGQVAARPSETGDKTQPDRIFVKVEDDRDCRDRLGRRRSGVSDGDEHGDPSMHQSMK
jgi:hypothetical protein